MQQTLTNKITLTGVGLHSGADVAMTLRPAPVDSGIVFIRSDVTDKNNMIPARWDHVVDTRLCTVIGNEDGVTVGTVEHLMAALRGCGVDNAIIELDGPEVPIMDGSSEPFVKAIDRAGTEEQVLPRRAIKILKEVTVQDGDKFAMLKPGIGCVFTGQIDFEHPAIGVQKREIRLLNGNFRHDLADARTFGFLHEVEALRKSGLALGGSLDNAIVLDRDGVMNDSGLRYHDEFVRHKLLDAIGDLYLAGGQILGVYESHKAGHALNNALLRALFADDSAWTIVNMFIDMDDARGTIRQTDGAVDTIAAV